MLHSTTADIIFKSVWQQISIKQDLHTIYLYRLMFANVREYLMIYRGPGFLDVVRFDPPLPPNVGKLNLRHTGILRKRDNLLTGEWGGGGGGAKSYDGRETLVLYKSFHTFWSTSFCPPPITPHPTQVTSALLNRKKMQT
jgi:hypothetical protein